jgi:tetratricopeptide (TPR) repeat protein
LLLYRQKNTENPAFSDLLIWYFTAIKEFRPAFTQLKGLVKRLGGGHQRILSLAIQAYKFEDYETAQEAVDFINNANLNQQGFLGDVQGLDLLLKQLKCLDNCPSWLMPAKAFVLSGKYSQFRMNLTRKVFDTYNKYVHADSAAHFLDLTINSPVYNDQEKGYFKLWKGDWWLENDDVWEAALLYGQVERRFKEDLLGGEAKYRSALISYYTGDFAWAQAQLKVLKASTSKLMANDALQLGVLISDNLGVDSVDIPLIRFSQADLKLKQNKRAEAREILNTILADFPGHSLEDEIWFRFFTLDRAAGNIEGALAWLNKIRDLRSDDLFSDDAVFFLAELEEEAGDIAKARAFYLELLKDHPDSFFTEQARRKIRKLDSNDHL